MSNAFHFCLLVLCLFLCLSAQSQQAFPSAPASDFNRIPNKQLKIDLLQGINKAYNIAFEIKTNERQSLTTELGLLHPSLLSMTLSAFGYPSLVTNAHGGQLGLVFKHYFGQKKDASQLFAAVALRYRIQVENDGFYEETIQGNEQRFPFTHRRNEMLIQGRLGQMFYGRRSTHAELFVGLGANLRHRQSKVMNPVQGEDLRPEISRSIFEEGWQLMPHLQLGFFVTTAWGKKR